MNKVSASVKYSDEFESIILSKAIELDKKGLSEGPLNDSKFKDIIVYLNKVPAFCLYKCTISNESPFLKGKTICAGNDSTTNLQLYTTTEN